MKRIEFELPEEYIVECEGTQSLEVYFTYYTGRINGKYKYILVCEDKYTLHICNDINALDIEYQNLPIVSYEFWKSFQEKDNLQLQEELKVGDWVKVKSREECEKLSYKGDPRINSIMDPTFGTYQQIKGIYSNGYIINGYFYIKKWFDKVTELPEKWCFKVTNENYEKFRHIRALADVKGYISSLEYVTIPWGLWVSQIPPDFEKIPFEMFEDFILKPLKEKEIKMEKKLIGYKLNGKVTAEQVAELLSCPSTIKDGMFFWENSLNGNVIQEAKDLGILDLWFNPVYEEPYKVGDWVIFEGYSDRYDGKAVKITNIVDNNYVYFTPCENTCHNGSIHSIKRKATEEEIKKVMPPHIDIQGYTANFGENSVTFGCMTFSTKLLSQLKELEKRYIISFNKEYYEQIQEIYEHFDI